MNNEALELIRSTDAISYCRNRAGSYIESAVSALANDRDNEIYPELVELANFTVKRIN